MLRVLRLSLFAVAAVAVLLGSAWVFRGELLRLWGVSFDRGAPGASALSVPAGFEASVFASGLRRPRFMAVSGDGTLFVAEMDADRVVSLPDADGDGRSDRSIIVGEGYGSAHSLAFTQEGTLLVAGTGDLFEVELGDDLREVGRRRLLTYPSGGSHSTRTIVVAPDGTMLLSIGSTCNACWEEDERRAAILSAAADGSGSRVLMRGLRNAVGIAIDPQTGVAWATNNGRDWMGDDSPPETLYRVVDGADAGWPRCHAGDVLDPGLGDEADPGTGRVGCDGVVAPAATFQAHAAPLGIAFWDDHAVIAFHGSWNRSTKVGYEVLWLPWEDGPAGPPQVLVEGFLDTRGESTGRPAGVTAGGDGALYVSDDKGGFIYRVTGPA